MEALSPQTLGAIHKIRGWGRRLPRVWLRRVSAATVLLTLFGYSFFCPEAPLIKEIAFRRQFGDYANVLRRPVSVTLYTVGWDGNDMNLDFKWNENPTTHFHGLLISERKTYTDAPTIQRIVRYTEPVKVGEFCGCAFEPESGARILGADGKAVDLLMDKHGFDVIILTKRGSLKHEHLVKHKQTLASLLQDAVMPEADPNLPPIWFR